VRASQDYGGRWHCGECNAGHATEHAAEACCCVTVSPDQEQLDLGGGDA